MAERIRAARASDRALFLELMQALDERHAVEAEQLREEMAELATRTDVGFLQAADQLRWLARRRPVELRRDVIRALRHARNIRGMREDDSIAVIVTGPDAGPGVEGFGAEASGGDHARAFAAAESLFHFTPFSGQGSAMAFRMRRSRMWTHSRAAG